MIQTPGAVFKKEVFESNYRSSISYTIGLAFYNYSWGLMRQTFSCWKWSFHHDCTFGEISKHCKTFATPRHKSNASLLSSCPTEGVLVLEPVFRKGKKSISVQSDYNVSWCKNSFETLIIFSHSIIKLVILLNCALNCMFISVLLHAVSFWQTIINAKPFLPFSFFLISFENKLYF